MRQPRTAGFTLPELCVALALVGVLVSAAIPAFREAWRATAVRTAAFELLAAVQQTRSSAIAANLPAVFCLVDFAGNCLASGGDGARGWRVFVPGADSSQALSSGELAAGLQLRATRARLTFSPVAIAASTGTLTICDAQGVARGREIIVSQSGRARLALADPQACRA
jgi:prepilin-type N-terminal cleavage/methylation domain-containing protein